MNDIALILAIFTICLLGSCVTRQWTERDLYQALCVEERQC